MTTIQGHKWSCCGCLSHCCEACVYNRDIVDVDPCRVCAQVVPYSKSCYFTNEVAEGELQ